MDRTCSIEGCERPRWARGWCAAHYRRWRLRGDPGGLIRGITAEERIWPRVDKAGPIPVYASHLGNCWLWTGARDKLGYGRLTRTLAHRLVYELMIGPIPEGLELDHLCRNPSCVRPEHLEPVTHRENLLRGVRANQNTGKTHCLRGHALDTDNTYVRRNGARACKACQLQRQREWVERRKAS